MILMKKQVEQSIRQESNQNSAQDEQLKKQLFLPKKLNWTNILYDQNIFVDAQTFRKWDGNLHFQGQQLLEKDLVRTRMNEPYFHKPATKKLLKRLTTFYCIQNRVHYQQGLLQVVIPFALLHRKDFQSRKCYAYFNSFMRKYFPKVLNQKIIENKKELPHAVLAITLSQILLRYHYPQIYHTLTINQIPVSMIVTQQILTIFAKNMKIPLVYQIFNFFMNKKNKNYLLYMCIALVGLKQKEILEKAEDQLHSFVNKSLKKFQTVQELDAWFKKSEEIEYQTPKSFQILTKKLGFNDKSFLTMEDFSQMMKLQDQLIQFIMPVYREQIDLNPKHYVFIVLAGEVPSKNYQCKRISYPNSEEDISQSEIRSILRIPSEKILVIGYSKGNEKEEKVKLAKLITQVNLQSSYKYKFMMFQSKLEEQTTCSIY